MKYELNQYLFFEFGFEGDESQVSSSWPFQLNALGEVDGEHVFEFSAEGEEYYAVYGRLIYFECKDGADLDLFRIQGRGARWIGSQQPVDLSTSRGEHPVIPLLPERRAKIEELARSLGRSEPPRILEGLFFESSREYLALIEFPGESVVHVVGSSIQITDVQKPNISNWKILARAIGSRVG